LLPGLAALGRYVAGLGSWVARTRGVPLESLVLHGEVTEHSSADSVRAPPAEGVFLGGLTLVGAGWASREGGLVKEEVKERETQDIILLQELHHLVRSAQIGRNGNVLDLGCV